MLTFTRSPDLVASCFTALLVGWRTIGMRMVHATSSSRTSWSMGSWFNCALRGLGAFPPLTERWECSGEVQRTSCLGGLIVRAIFPRGCHPHTAVFGEAVILHGCFQNCHFWRNGGVLSHRREKDIFMYTYIGVTSPNLSISIFSIFLFWNI